MTRPFGVRLRAVMDARGPLCVGIDPHVGLLHAWDLPDDATGLERFALTCVEALADQVPVLKPQSAFFERYGSRGIAVLERTVREARSAGALVITDAKRGDIGSTMTAYAQAYLDQSSELATDALTVSPYLGYESLRPALDLAAAQGAGVFVLGLTSNPEGPSVQHARTPGGSSVARSVVDAVGRDNGAASDLGHVGLVVGATVDPQAVTELGIDFAASRAPLLAPGLGAQGGGAAELAAVFGAARRNVLPSSSREVLQSGPDRVALRDAAKRTLDVVRTVLT